MKTRIVVWLAVTALAAPVAGAQDPVPPPSTLVPGDRVRLEKTPDRKGLIATIESVTEGELVVKSVKTSETLRLDRSQLHNLEVSRGQRTQWRKGAKIGFVPGFLFFGFAGGAAACIDTPDCSWQPGYGLVTGVLGGAVTGGLGALIGLAYKTDRWVPVPEPKKPRVSVMLAPIPGQARFGVTVSF